MMMVLWILYFSCDTPEYTGGCYAEQFYIILLTPKIRKEYPDPMEELYAVLSFQQLVEDADLYSTQSAARKCDTSE